MGGDYRISMRNNFNSWSSRAATEIIHTKYVGWSNFSLGAVLGYRMYAPVLSKLYSNLHPLILVQALFVLIMDIVLCMLLMKRNL